MMKPKTLNLLMLLVLIPLLIYVADSAAKLSEREKRNREFKTISQDLVETPRPTLAPILKPIPTKAPYKIDGGRLFNLVNEYRTKNGLKALEWYHPLCAYSTERSGEIEEDFSHAGFYETASSGAMYSEWCNECLRTGENLAKNYSTEKEILDAWIVSPGHKANLDGDWDWGCAMVAENNYTSMLFGKKR